MNLTCPECQGVAFISLGHLNPAYQGEAVRCPNCDGTGTLPDPAEFPKNCPACGEPIRANQGWCDFHKAAAILEKR